MHRRSVHDREILRLALPALGALASLMWLWAVICLFMTARLAGNVLRFAGGGWQVTGAVRSA